MSFDAIFSARIFASVAYAGSKAVFVVALHINVMSSVNVSVVVRIIVSVSFLESPAVFPVTAPSVTPSPTNDRKQFVEFIPTMTLPKTA